MGTSASQEAFVAACKDRDLDDFKKAIQRHSSSDPCDVFNIIFKSRLDENDVRDYISLLLDPEEINDPSLLLSFLELFKKIINENKQNKNKKFAQPQPEKMLTGYLESIARHQPNAIDAFRFFLDNEETFPTSLLWKTDKNGNSRLLHYICANDRGVEMLREFLSSGKVPECYRNSDNDGEKMRFAKEHVKDQFYDFKALIGKTPLQIACKQLNSAAVQELVVAKVGGENYGECVADLISSIESFHHLGAKKVNASVLEIIQCLLSQPGSDSIRNLVIDTRNQSWFHDQLQQRFGYFDDIGKCTLPAFALHRNDMKLFNTLLDNRCVGPKDFPRYFSNNLFKFCRDEATEDWKKKDNYAGARRILVYYRAAEWFLDLEKESPPEKEKSKDIMQQLTPLQAAVKANNFYVCELLINAGASVARIEMPKEYQVYLDKKSSDKE